MTTARAAAQLRSGFLPSAVALLVLGATLSFTLNLHEPRGPQVLGWLPGPLALFLAGLSLWRAATTPRLPAAARRFWRNFATVTALCALGMAVHAYDRLHAARAEPKGSTPGSVLVLLVLLGAVWTLIRVPVGPRTTAAWIRLSLDGATVILGAGLFMWYVAFAPMLTDGRGLAAVWTQVAIGAVCLAALSAVVKIVLAGAGPVDAGAMRMLGVGLLAGGLSAGAASLVPHTSGLEPGQVSSPVIAWLLVVAGQRQRRATSRSDQHPRPLKRRYSLLPYAAVAATDILLVLATRPPGDDRRHVVVAGAITVTALVVVRQLVAFVDNARLVDQLRHREDQLRHQASHDALTQLANRDLFGEQVDAAIDAAGPAGDLAVLLVDLDDFKTVNDTLGHAVGDALLAAVAQRIRHCVRPEDTVARLGGDEFAVLLQQALPGAVEARAEQILASLAHPLVAHGYELLVQASIGVAVAGPGDDTGTLLRNADIAMYAAKEHGKGGFARYVPGMAANILEHAHLGAQLRQALDESQLYLLYQPIVRLDDRRIVGVETLIRWRHPTRGCVPPGEFIPAAERTGLIVPLGRWVLREACRQNALWRAAHGDNAPATVSVNVSGRQLQEPRFAGEVADAVHETGIQPHQLILEVTETAVLTGGHVFANLTALHDFGVGLALDDFGTGQSSLGLLRTCPVHMLKLDKSFVDRVTDGEQHAAVATAVVEIAQALGLQAVAEGVESQEQAEHLRMLGYRLGQGFHLIPPLSADELSEVLDSTVVRR